MAANTINKLLGSPFDALCDTLGLSPMKLRYGSKVLKPSPQMEFKGVQPVDQIAPGDLQLQEYTETWAVSIPEDTLRSNLGANWRDAVQAGQLWYATRPNETDWIPVKTIADPKVGDRQHVVFRLISVGILDN